MSCPWELIIKVIVGNIIANVDSQGNKTAMRWWWASCYDMRGRMATQSLEAITITLLMSLFLGTLWDDDEPAGKIWEGGMAISCRRRLRHFRLCRAGSSILGLLHHNTARQYFSKEILCIINEMPLHHNTCASLVKMYNTERRDVFGYTAPTTWVWVRAGPVTGGSGSMVPGQVGLGVW